MAYKSKKPHTITTPSGKTITYDNERQARMHFGMMLYDNRYCTKPNAQRHAAKIVAGEPYTIPTIGTYLMEKTQ